MSAATETAAPAEVGGRMAVTRELEKCADGSIDAGLTLLLARAAQDGRIYSHREIAEVCGCSWQFIWQTEQRALKKLKQALEARGVRQAEL